MISKLTRRIQKGRSGVTAKKRLKRRAGRVPGGRYAEITRSVRGYPKMDCMLASVRAVKGKKGKMRHSRKEQLPEQGNYGGLRYHQAA